MPSWVVIPSLAANVGLLVYVAWRAWRRAKNQLEG